MRWLKHWWYARLRQIDLEILWPICKQKSRSLDVAKASFAVHAMQDPAWLVLGDEAIGDFIERLS